MYSNHIYNVIFQHFSGSLLKYSAWHRDRRVLLVVTLVAVALLSVVVHTTDPSYAYVSGLDLYLLGGSGVWQVLDFSVYVPEYVFAQVQDGAPPPNIDHI